MELDDIENIICEYGNVIYKFCIKLTGNKDDGEDLYQQTFLKALKIPKGTVKSRLHKAMF